MKLEECVFNTCDVALKTFRAWPLIVFHIVSDHVGSARSSPGALTFASLRSEERGEKVWSAGLDVRAPEPLSRLN